MCLHGDGAMMAAAVAAAQIAFWVDFGVDFYFWVDIVLNFNTPFYDARGILEINRTRIAQECVSFLPPRLSYSRLEFPLGDRSSNSLANSGGLLSGCKG